MSSEALAATSRGPQAQTQAQASRRQGRKQQSEAHSCSTATGTADRASIAPQSPSLSIDSSFKSIDECRLDPKRIVYIDHMFSVDGFLAPFECRAFIAYAESVGFTECFQAQSRDYAFRKHGRLECQLPDIASQIFDRLRPYLSSSESFDGLRPIGCSDNIRLYRYRCGEQFGKHVDGSNRDVAKNAVSTHTVLIYLSANSELSGGDTLFYQECDNGTTSRSNRASNAKGKQGKLGSSEATTDRGVIRIAPICGRLLVHRHGDFCLTHEASAVTKGCKYVLRTDVLCTFSG